MATGSLLPITFDLEWVEGDEFEWSWPVSYADGTDLDWSGTYVAEMIPVDGGDTTTLTCTAVHSGTSTTFTVGLAYNNAGNVAGEYVWRARSSTDKVTRFQGTVRITAAIT